MDIAALSTALSQIQVQQQASLSVTKMAMDSGKTQASEMLRMMEASSQAVDPNLGRIVDIKL